MIQLFVQRLSTFSERGTLATVFPWLTLFIFNQYCLYFYTTCILSHHRIFVYSEKQDDKPHRRNRHLTYQQKIRKLREIEKSATYSILGWRRSRVVTFTAIRLRGPEFKLQTPARAEI